MMRCAVHADGIQSMSKVYQNEREVSLSLSVPRRLRD